MLDLVTACYSYLPFHTLTYSFMQLSNSLQPNIKIIIKNNYLCSMAASNCFKFFKKTLLMLHIDEIRTVYFLEQKRKTTAQLQKVTYV